jgi:hypothetical protein
MRTTCEHFVPLETECGHCVAENVRRRFKRAHDILTAYWCACKCRRPDADPCFNCENLKKLMTDERD